MIVAEVERAQTAQRVVDKGGSLHFVVGEVKQLQVPLVNRVILVQQLNAVGGGINPPEGTR